METQRTEARLKRLNAWLAEKGYIPPREAWTPADEALYKPLNLVTVPLDEAQVMQFKAIKYAVKHHYTLSPFYGRYCDKRGFTPDDLKTYDDLEKVPLIPDLTFKAHPQGEDFAHWLANIYTGELPTLHLPTADPNLDDIMNACNAAGLVVVHSTGTSGRPSVIPRDMKSYLAQQSNFAKTHFALWDDMDIDHTLLLLPKPEQTNMWAGKGPVVMHSLANDIQWALDMEITVDSALRSWTGQDQGDAQQSAQAMLAELFVKGETWLERYEHSADTIQIFTGPPLMVAFMDYLERRGKRFDFGERGEIRGGGGWKTLRQERIDSAEYFKRIEELLGIRPTNIEDGYSSAEINTLWSSCPEGHYYHSAYTHVKPLVLDKELEPVGYDEWGRLATLDATAGSYPGFIMSGDRVRMLEHCPVCDRPGPVLDRMIDRLESAEMRGCAATISGIFRESIERAQRGRDE